MPASFEISGNFIRALTKALTRAGQLEAVIAAAPSAGPACRDPFAQQWWPGAESTAMTLGIEQVGGRALVRSISHQAIFESMSVILRPFISTMVIISGSTPVTLFSRMGQLTSSAIRGVDFRWEASGPSAGRLVITYPQPVPDCFADYWLGVGDFVFEMTRTKAGTCRTSRAEGAVTLEASW